MSLYIYVADQKLRELYCAHKLSKHRYTDSGFDVLLPEQIISFDNNFPRTIHTAVVVAAVNDHEQPTPCLLLPRSSISNTVYRLTNSIGLIDMGYRGEVMAKCDSSYPNDNTGYLIDEGTRLFQIVQHNFLPWKNIYIVDDMSKLPAAPDNRGTGGFGSTG